MTRKLRPLGRNIISDRVYIGGVEVGHTESHTDEGVGEHCQGYGTDDCSRIAFDLNDPLGAYADITGFNDGTYSINIGSGKPITLEEWKHLLRDVTSYIEE